MTFGSFPTLTRVGAGVPLPPWLSARYYDGGYGATGTFALVGNTLYAEPIVPVGFNQAARESVSLDRLGIEITTNAANGKLVRCGLYTTGTDGKPNALIVDTGSLAADAIAYVEATIAVVVQSGVPIFRVVVSDSTPTVRSEGSTGFRYGVSAGTSVTGSPALSVSFTYGSLPATFPAGCVPAAAAPRILVRRT